MRREPSFISLGNNPVDNIAFDFLRLEGTAQILSPISVLVDVKPRDPDNKFRLGVHHRTIPVAILSTDEFDATQVDPATVRFGPDEAPAVGYRVQGHGTMTVIGTWYCASRSVKQGSLAATPKRR